MYANESKGEKFPPMQVATAPGETEYWEGLGNPLFRAIYPNYLTDFKIDVCPSSKMAGQLDELTEPPDCRWCDASGHINPDYIAADYDLGLESYWYTPWTNYENPGVQVTWFACWNMWPDLLDPNGDIN